MKLRLHNINYQCGRQKFYFHVALDANITGVYGPSGAGKTTLLNIIAGLCTPSSGDIWFNDQLFYRNHPQKVIASNKRNIGVVFQSGYLFPHLNVKQNLLYSSRYGKNKVKFIDFETVVDILQLNLLLTKKPAHLSGGEKQRVAIGRALLSQPQLLLLDEPFSSLDHQKRKQIIGYLLNINHQFNIPMIVISHDIEDILRLTKHFLVVNNGSIEASGNYLDIANSGKVPDIIQHKQYLNVFDACYFNKLNRDLSIFTPEHNKGTQLLVNSGLDREMIGPSGKVRFCIRPDDIALSNNKIADVSIQNQLSGVVEEIISTNNSAFVNVNCGYSLISEVTQTAIDKMKLHKGKKINVLIKTKAIEVVNVF